MKCEIKKIGLPVLRKKVRRLAANELRKPRFKRLLTEMVAAMRTAQGVGIAANQIGVDASVIAMECARSRRYPEAPSFALQIYINPRITSASSKTLSDWEGCLSVPGYRGLVPRAARLTFTALTPEGRRVTKELIGFEARVMQHEVDHINGRLYVDRVRDFRDWMHVDEFSKKFLRRGRLKS